MSKTILQRVPTAPLESDDELSVVSGLVCATYRIAPGDLHAPTRLNRETARARQVAVYLAHVGLGITLSAAARWFGRDPSTASHACRMIENARDEAGLDLALARLEQALAVWRADHPFRDTPHREEGAR